ncbi:thiol reductant ABC exporter subunit CydD [Actinocorallia longicatena]|uniref:ATP-binding cassette subfamily C protein CydD n=1 Tax=Actinocorallia longicatena TaxID=111803 RepID=A0ABP6Q1M4_9ACTN
MRPFDPRLARHARGARRYLAVCTGIGVLGALCAIAQARLLAEALSTLTVPLALLAVFAVRALLAWAQEAAAHRASAGVKADLRRAVLASALSGSAPGPAGTVAALVTRGVDALDPYFSRYLPQVVLAAIVPVMVLAVLAVTDPATAAIVAVTLPLIPVFGYLVGSCTEARTARQWRTLERLAGHFADVAGGLMTLKAFGRARFQSERIAKVSAEHRRATMASLRIAFCSALVLELAATLSVAVVAVSVGLRLLEGNLSFGTALFLLILAPEAYLPLRQAGAHFHAAQEGLAAAESVFAAIAPVPAAAPGPVPDGIVGVRGLVAREGLAPVTFDAPPGVITALTAPSGGGKSSLFAVLLGLLPPVEGSVRAGGAEVVPGDAWRRRVAWLPQHPHLFTGTVAENIAVAVPGASAAAVRDAAGLTGVLEFTTLETVLGAGGHGLSAGQRQRLALARVALRCALLDPVLLLLDEPTAHLDVATELDVADLIDRLAAGRTTLVATHRRALVERAGNVLAWPSAPVAPREPVPA